MERSALFSPDRQHRYDLRRVWEPAKGLAMFVGLNPSTADEEQNDPTVWRCQNFTGNWGFGGLIMCNLFAYRATYPRDLRAARDPIGPDNDEHLRRCAGEARIVVAAWGVNGKHLDRAQRVIDAELLGSFKVLGLTKGGHPLHPLYVKATAKPLDPWCLREEDL